MLHAPQIIVHAFVLIMFRPTSIKNKVIQPLIKAPSDKIPHHSTLKSFLREKNFRSRSTNYYILKDSSNLTLRGENICVSPIFIPENRWWIN